LKESIQPAPPSILILPGLAKGDWEAELWDTWQGRIIETRRVDVPDSGEARSALPAVEKDLAVKLRRRKDA